MRRGVLPCPRPWRSWRRSWSWPGWPGAISACPGRCPPNSDGPANALQAQDMLRGNLLLRGWTLTDVSFYTTELWEYAAIEVVRWAGRSLSVGMAVVHTAAAVTYTLLVLLAGLLARGAPGVARGWPEPWSPWASCWRRSSGTARSSCCCRRITSARRCRCCWDGWCWTGRPGRWYVVAFTGVLLAWVQVADQGGLLAAVLPLTVVCAVRAAAGSRRAGAWFEASLAAVAVASAVVAWVVHHADQDEPGVCPVPGTGRSFRAEPAAGAPEADGARSGAAVRGRLRRDLGAPRHLLCRGALRRASRGVGGVRGRSGPLRRLGLVGQVLVVSIACTVAAYALSDSPGVSFGTGYEAREMAAVLPLGAALAGRMTGPFLRGRVRQATAAAVSPATFRRCSTAPRSRRCRARRRSWSGGCSPSPDHRACSRTPSS